MGGWKFQTDEERDEVAQAYWGPANEISALQLQLAEARAALASAKAIGAAEELERIAKDLQSRERGEWAFTSGPALEARAAELRKELA